MQRTSSRPTFRFFLECTRTESYKKGYHLNRKMRMVPYFVFTVWAISIDYFIRRDFNLSVSFWEWSSIDIAFYVIFILSSWYAAPYLYFESFKDSTKRDAHSLHHSRSILFSASVLLVTLAMMFVLVSVFQFVAERFPYREQLPMFLALVAAMAIIVKADIMGRIARALDG
jgi:hypothetical protein